MCRPNIASSGVPPSLTSANVPSATPVSAGGRRGGAANCCVVVNINDPEFDEPRERAGFQVARARLGYQLGTERLGLSLWELPAGQAAYPYHYHLGEEEIVVVVAGAPSLRTPDGWRVLREGEVVAFPRGDGGAHQLANHSEETVRFLALSTNGEPDIVLYPDSSKVGAAERLPRGGGLRTFFRLGDAVDYWEGETPPPRG
jgi:uncharacterized cupin superfamily protein